MLKSRTSIHCIHPFTSLGKKYLVKIKTCPLLHRQRNIEICNRNGRGGLVGCPSFIYSRFAYTARRALLVSPSYIQARKEKATNPACPPRAIAFDTYIPLSQEFRGDPQLFSLCKVPLSLSRTHTTNKYNQSMP